MTLRFQGMGQGATYAESRRSRRSWRRLTSYATSNPSARNGSTATAASVPRIDGQIDPRLTLWPWRVPQWYCPCSGGVGRTWVEQQMEAVVRRMGRIGQSTDVGGRGDRAHTVLVRKGQCPSGKSTRPDDRTRFGVASKMDRHGGMLVAAKRRPSRGGGPFKSHSNSSHHNISYTIIIKHPK